MQQQIEDIYVAGLKVELAEMAKEELKGVSVGEAIIFTFYRAELAGTDFVLLVPKSDRNQTPAFCAITSGRLSPRFNLPIVFFFHNLKFYERQRLIEKGVYFITGRGEAFLPNMVMLSRPKSQKTATRLSASAQFLLLYHLQKGGLDGLSVSEIAGKVSQYSYVSVAKAVENLESLGLCECAKDDGRSKRLRFLWEGRELWDKAKPYMSSPVKEVRYCDAIPPVKFQYAGISALSSYTRLCPDEFPTIAVYSGDFKESDFQGLNSFDGKVMVEIWRYPALDIDSRMADKLSLYLSLEADPDPRVENENETMLEKIWQTK